jgi:hypothetical protein
MQSRLDLCLSGISMLNDKRLDLFIAVFSVTKTEFILESLAEEEKKVLFAADVFFISLMSSLYLQSHLVNSSTEPWSGTPSILFGMIHLIGKVFESIGALI